MAFLQFLGIQGIGQVKGHALVFVQAVAQLIKKKSHLEMSHGIGRHHQFKSVKIFKDVVANKIFPATGAVLGLELGHGGLGGPGHECHGAGGRVQQGHAVGGQAVTFAKGVFKNFVKGANNISDHRLGCVVDAPALPLGRVVLGQKGFIKMDDGVTALAFMIIPVKNTRRIGHGQHLCDVVHAPSQLFIQVV